MSSHKTLSFIFVHCFVYFPLLCSSSLWLFNLFLFFLPSQESYFQPCTTRIHTTDCILNFSTFSCLSTFRLSNEHRHIYNECYSDYLYCVTFYIFTGMLVPRFRFLGYVFRAAWVGTEVLAWSQVPGCLMCIFLGYYSCSDLHFHLCYICPSWQQTNSCNCK